MRFSFSQAIEKLAQGCNSAIKSVQERVLPTPGKRKRSEEEVPLEEEEEKRRSPRHRPSHVEVTLFHFSVQQWCKSCCRATSAELLVLVAAHGQSGFCQPAVSVCSRCSTSGQQQRCTDHRRR